MRRRRPSTPLSYYNVTATLWGIQWATATILVGCDLGATASRRNAIAKAGVEVGGEWPHNSLVEGEAPALDPHLYLKSKKARKALEINGAWRRGWDLNPGDQRARKGWMGCGGFFLQRTIAVLQQECDLESIPSSLLERRKSAVGTPLHACGLPKPSSLNKQERSFPISRGRG